MGWKRSFLESMLGENTLGTNTSLNLGISSVLIMVSLHENSFSTWSSPSNCGLYSNIFRGSESFDTSPSLKFQSMHQHFHFDC